VRAILVFGAGLLVVVVTLAALLWMLRPRLRTILVDVLGTEARAGFWVAVASWWIGIVGLLAGSATFGYSSGIGGSGGDLLAALLTQLRTFLAGLLGALLVVALLLLRAMRREPEGRGARAVRVDPAAPARLGTRPPAPPESWPVS
jgi:ABC-type branched-subunit amino acid transport system permease subunit